MLAFAFSMNADAQVLLTCTTNSNTTTRDTLNNVDEAVFVTPVNAINDIVGGAFTLQVYKTEISGTSNVNFVVEGSLDGTNWVRVHGTPGADGINCDTLLLADAAGLVTGKFNVRPGSMKVAYTVTHYTGAGRFTRIRVRAITGGTQSVIITQPRLLKNTF